MIITPTVGRVVLYTPSAHDLAGAGGMARLGEQKMAAIVACVHSDRMVSLSVFDANGKQYNRTSIRLIQEGDPEPDPKLGFYCEWMPYQKGQAAKTEALEKELAEKPAQE